MLIEGIGLETKKTIVMLLVISLVSAVGAVILYFQTPSTQKQYQMMQISTASMEPALMQGSYIMVDPNVNPEDLNADYPDSDIIVFHRPGDPDSLIAHRIVAKEEINGTTCFYTKGDANGAKYPATVNSSDYDPWVVSPDLLVGKVVTDTDSSQMVPLTLGFRVLLIVSIVAGVTSLGVYVYARLRKK